MKTILLTGCAGFIGHKTAEMLLAQGNRIIGIDNLNDYYDVRLKEYRLERLKLNKNFNFFPIDLENTESVNEIFKNNLIDGVINLAARAGVPYSLKNPYVYLTTNTLGVLNILEAMAKYNVKKLVQASTSSLYAGEEMPFSEELSVNTPISTYAATKKAAELLAYTYHHLYDLDITILRYFTVFGPAGRPDMSIFRFIKWIDEGGTIELFGDGNQSRDFTYVDDIARGTILALKPLGYEVINLGGGKDPKTINYVIDFIENLLDKKAIIQKKTFLKTDIKETKADNSKAKNILGWIPEISLEEGLKRSVDWYNENKVWLKDIRL